MVTILWIWKFVNNKQMAFLLSFISQQLLFLFSKHLDTMSNVTYCRTDRTDLWLKEAEIDEQNEKFAKGEANFEEELEPWDDLSEDEIIKEKTGLEEGEERFNPMRTGLLVKPEHERVNTPEERAFLDEIYAKHDRTSIPKFWDSRTKGK